MKIPAINAYLLSQYYVLCKQKKVEKLQPSNETDNKKNVIEEKMSSRVKAEVRSDDFVFEVEFDCTAWFEQASEEELWELYKCGWRGDYPADEVARYCSVFNFDVRCVLDYASRKEEMGFEVIVYDESAIDWLQDYEPQIVRRIMEDENPY